MHGRPRKPTKVEDLAVAAAKAEKLRSLQTQLIHNHHNRIYTKEALEVSSKLLEVNPEVYTAWNYRKLAVQSIVKSLEDKDKIKDVVNGELRIVEVALRRNPKSYGAWHHRKWVLQKELLPTDFDHEFLLLNRLLMADTRNFHGWNYRRFVAALKNVSEEEELKFMTDKINENFSNYSAWHNRSVLLSQLLKGNAQDSCNREKLLEEELELVHQALFTDPDDQSGWFYYLWLLDQTTTSNNLVVISSWPVEGSNIVFSNNKIMDVHSSLSGSNSVILKETMPVVLCFNQPIKDVNSATVILQSSFTMNEDLTWKPLGITNSKGSYYWVTYIKVPIAQNDASNIYHVEIIIDHLKGIMSPSSSKLSRPYKFRFTIDTSDLKSIGRNFAEEMVVWGDDNSYTGILLAPEVCADSLIKMQIKDFQPAASKWQIKTLSKEIPLFKELLSQIDCKIAKVMVARLLVALDTLMSNEFLSSQKKVHTEAVLKLYDELMELDPSHVGYYKDERGLVLLDQVTHDKELLAKHCWRSIKLNSPLFQKFVILRLNNMFLSRIGFTERLLWVQMLDLSNNELKSIEGLEAMQILCCLNLGRNRISSFTALEPLKQLPLLKVLDISYNEIGAHPIDTTRYLCASPLSHSMSSSFDIKGHGKNKIKGSDAWEAILLFQDLQLTQLDIEGNAIANSEFREMLIKLLPTLSWFDGATMERS